VKSEAVLVRALSHIFLSGGQASPSQAKLLPARFLRKGIEFGIYNNPVLGKNLLLF